MFLKSKYDNNYPINTNTIAYPLKYEEVNIHVFRIIFGKLTLWRYYSEHQRNEEYEWVIDHLECIAND